MKLSTILWIFLPLVTFFLLLSYPDLAMMQDLGRHLKLGEIMTSCHCVIHTNLFSFTEPNFPFIDHHWFSELIFYWLYKTGGFGSLLVFKIITLTFSFTVSFYLAYRKAGIKIAALLSIFFLFIFSERFYTRPELVSFVCLAIFLWAIDEYKTKNITHYLFFLPLVELLWTNSHIYFPIGVGLLFLLSVEQFYRRSKHWKLIVSLFAVTAAVTIINPNGLTGALYPLHILDHYGYTIIENQSVFFLNTFFFNGHILVFEIIAVLYSCLLIIRIKKIDFFWLTASVLAMISAFEMIRNFSLFVLVAFPYMAQLIYQLLHSKQPSVKRVIDLVGVAASLGLLLIVIYSRFSLPGKWFSYEPGAGKAVAFFQKANLKGPIFNNFDIGSYLIYRLYPRERVFVDGRPEAYPVSFFTMYEKMQENPAFFAQMVHKYHLNTIVFAHTDITPWAQSFMASIIHNPNWVPVYLDDVMIILVKNTPQNQAIIQRYRITLSG